MYRRLANCWYFVFPVVSAFAAPEVLSYQQLLDSWNATLYSRFYPDYQYQETVSDVVSWVKQTTIHDGIWEPPVLRSPFRFIYPEPPSTYGPIWSSSYNVPVNYFATRSSHPSNNFRFEPAGLYINTNGVFTSSGQYVISSSNVWPQEVFEWPPQWDWCRESMSFAQSNHLPVALAVLTYPGFTEWALDNFTSTAQISYGYPFWLQIKSRQVLWNSVRSAWAPGVLRAIGYSGSATNYIPNNPPLARFTWSPSWLTPELYIAPFYPGPIWYDNQNRIGPDGQPDYILSQVALSLIQEEFDSPGFAGEENPFGNASWCAYVVAPCDSDGVPHMDFNFRLLATVEEKQ